MSAQHRPGESRDRKDRAGDDDHHKIGAEPLSLDPRALSQAAARAAQHHAFITFSRSIYKNSRPIYKIYNLKTIRTVVNL